MISVSVREMKLAGRTVIAGPNASDCTNDTALAMVKPVPETVTIVPPAEEPLVGLTPGTTGGGLWYVKVGPEQTLVSVAPPGLATPTQSLYPSPPPSLPARVT